MECEFCKNVFVNSQNLRAHKKTAKYCLKIQGISTSNCFQCKICKNESSSKYNLDRHMLSHTDSEVEIFHYNQELEQKIKELVTCNQVEVENIRTQMEEKTTLEFINEPIYTHGFPWRIYDQESLNIEYIRLQKKFIKESIKVPLKISRIGYKCTDNFFQKQRLSTISDTNISCLDFWKKSQDKILQYYSNNKYKKDLFGIIVFMKRAPSHFSPYVAGIVYRYFNANTILDPYAGWGDRCLAAMCLNIKYIGIDRNFNLIECYDKLINFFPHTSSVKFICGKSEDIDFHIYNPNLIFSSPPFWYKGGLLEKYPQCEEDFEVFLSQSLFPLFNKYIGQVTIALYINKFMLDKLIEKYGDPKEVLEFNSSTVLHIANNTVHKIYCW